MSWKICIPVSRIPARYVEANPDGEPDSERVLSRPRPTFVSVLEDSKVDLLLTPTTFGLNRGTLSSFATGGKLPMKITLKDLKSQPLDRILVESVDLSLYIAHAEIQGHRRLIVDEKGKPLKTRNLLDMKAALSSLRGAEMVLIQSSAYDEMVGHSFSQRDNAMEISLAPGFESLPSWEH